MVKQILFLCCFFAALNADEVPRYLYKILSVENWNASTDYVKLPEEDHAFIHFSTEDQLDRIISKYWVGKNYVVLKVDTRKLPGKMVYEANPGGTNKYYHLYNGSIPMKAAQKIH